jgi:hypothetical protein
MVMAKRRNVQIWYMTPILWLDTPRELMYSGERKHPER